MVSLLHFFCFCSLFFLTKPIFSQQFYDKTDCTFQTQVPGSKYLCNSNRNPCQTFIIYRTQPGFNSLSSISSLFSSNQTELLTVNNLNKTTSLEIYLGQELIIPVNCSCSGRFSQAVFMYKFSNSDTFFKIACEVFEGLLKQQALVDQNPSSKGEISFGFEVSVPVRCACPDESDAENGIKYLVTYPIAESDSTSFLSKKFGVLEDAILAANNLEPNPTIYPNTTLLIPMNEMPVLNLEMTSPMISSPNPRNVIPLGNVLPSTTSKSRSVVIALGVGISMVILLLVVALGFFIRRQWYPRRFQPLSFNSSRLSSFSPDFLDGMSKLKHSLLNFSLDELRIATRDFCEDLVIGSSIYRGRMGESHLAIEEMDSEEEAHHVIDILTKINHLNIVRLEGFCHDTKAYLVFDYATNGSLRDCLSKEKLARELTWAKRMQILSDFAVGLHYMHYYTSPCYVHRNINSRNILITMDWRAKISGFKWAKSVTSSEEKEHNKWFESVIVGRKGYLAPEYLYHGLASPMMDVFAFGVVLLELISAKEALTDDGLMLMDSVRFLVEGELEGTSGCLEKLKGFMDPALEGDYPLGDAFCLALLAKGCVEENPHHRPNMNDVMKALSRFL